MDFYHLDMWSGVEFGIVMDFESRSNYSLSKVRLGDLPRPLNYTIGGRREGIG